LEKGLNQAYDFRSVLLYQYKGYVLNIDHFKENYQSLNLISYITPWATMDFCRDHRPVTGKLYEYFFALAGFEHGAGWAFYPKLYFSGLWSGTVIMALFFFSLLRILFWKTLKRSVRALDIYFIFLVVAGAAAWLWESLYARLDYVGALDYVLYMVPCVWILALKDLDEFNPTS